jgi:hypothetical protein
MRRGWIVVPVVVLVAAALAGAGWWYTHRTPALPPVDVALARAVTPTVNRALRESQGRGEFNSPFFCTQRILEIRRFGRELRVGVLGDCEQYEPSGRGLVRGTGACGGMVVTLTGHYRAVRVEEPDDDGYASSVHRLFSSAAAAAVDLDRLEQQLAPAEPRFPAAAVGQFPAESLRNDGQGSTGQVPKATPATKNVGR